MYRTSKTIYDISPNGIISLYGELIKSDQSTETQLVNIIKITLKYCKMSIPDSSIQSLNSNFAIIDTQSAIRLKNNMHGSLTLSHKKAWEYKIPNFEKYAIKLYYTKKDYWEISIIETGWYHLFDALKFLLELPSHEHVNIKNAYDLLYLLNQRIKL